MEKLDLGKWPAPAGAKPSATYFEISMAVLGRLPSSSQRRVPTRSNMNSLNRLTSTNRTEHRASLRKRGILASQMPSKTLVRSSPLFFWLFRIVRWSIIACTFSWPSFHVQEAISSVNVKDETWITHQWLSNPQRLAVEPTNPVLQHHCVRCGRDFVTDRSSKAPMLSSSRQ
jgi:hypothetical protein